MAPLADGTILLVEDEAIIGMATKARLEKLGYRVAHTTNAEAAVRQAVDDADVSLVLMDIDLGPHANGISASRDILKRRDLPIIFVSSHTEPETISLTESITSYGYIVKSSNIVAYDASIKMAYRLFLEKKSSQMYSRYIKTALENAAEPIFICDLNGDVVFFNKSYQAVQGLSDPAMVQTRFSDYSEAIVALSESGEPQDGTRLASMRALAGESGTDVVFYVYNKAIKRMLVNHYSYAPIRDDRDRIIGSYVKIGAPLDRPDEELLRTLAATYGFELA